MALLPPGVGDPYALLGLRSPVTPGQYELKDIRQAYRRKALELHPDKNPNDAQAAAKFNRLAAVLEYLSNESNRAHYDASLVEKEQRRRRAAAQDLEKKRLAAELRRRETAFAAAKAKQSETQFLQKAFRSRAAEDKEATRRWNQLRRQAELDRRVLKELNEEKREKPAVVSQFEVDPEHFYILTLHWHPSEQGMGPRSLHVLETLLKQPCAIQRCDADKGVAHVQFLSQAAALAAAMTFTVLEDDTLTFRATGLSPNALFSARVVKKPRAPQQGRVQRSAQDEEEDDRLIEERMAKELESKEAAKQIRERARNIIEQFDIPSDEEEDIREQGTKSAAPISVTPTNFRPLPASLMARLNLPKVVPASAPTVTGSPFPIDTSNTDGLSRTQPTEISSDTDEDELESSTLELLRQAVTRKKARLAQ